MRFLLTILALNAILICSGQVYSFEGVVFENNGGKLSDVVIKFSEDSVTTDSLGRFTFSRSEPRDALIEIRKPGFRTRTFLLPHSKPEKKISRIALCRLCKYDSSLRACPVCHLDDKVLDIVYGLPSPPFREDVYYEGHCDVTCCDPKYYCARDKIKF